MAASALSGEYYEATTNGANFFGHKLSRMPRGSWLLNDFIEVSADPVAHEVDSVIQTDRDTGNGDNIDHVLVDNRVAACLYAEGRITYQHMLDAREEGERVIIPNVPFLDQDYTVVVMHYEKVAEVFGTELRFATVDAKGEIV